MPEHIVDQNFINTRVDKYLRKLLPTLPLAGIYKLLRTGGIKINDRKVTPAYRLQAEDRIRLSPDLVPLTPTAGKQNEPPAAGPGEFPVLYEDEHYWIIRKPPNITVHPGEDSHKKSITSYLNRPGQLFSPSPMHRLDFNTSGCLLIARTRAGARVIAEYFSQQKISKFYLARVSGLVEKRLTLTTPIEDKPASTLVIPLAISEKSSIVLVSISTGRKHQIKVHLEKSGHRVRDLHCFCLSFIHPFKKKRITIYDNQIDWTDNSLTRRGKTYISNYLASL